MHTKVTYNYKHSVSHSYTLLANGLDETTTIQDGVSDFKAPEGPLLLQFTINDAPVQALQASRSTSSRRSTRARAARWSSTSARAATRTSTGNNRARSDIS